MMIDSVVYITAQPYLFPSPPSTHIHRAALRLFVVFKLRTGLLTTPSVPSPDRKKAQELVTNPQPPVEGEGEGEGEREGGGKPLAWRAPRTGKVIRSIHTGKGSPLIIIIVPSETFVCETCVDAETRS